MRVLKGKNVIVLWKIRKCELVFNVVDIFLWRVYVFEKFLLKDKNDWGSELAWFKSYYYKFGFF